MDLKGIMLSEKRPTQKVTQWMVPLKSTFCVLYPLIIVFGSFEKEVVAFCNRSHLRIEVTVQFVKSKILFYIDTTLKMNL